MLGLRRAIEESTVSARVIAGDAVPYFRTVTIDRGQGSGVRRDLAVISPDGVVGRVVGNPGQRAAKVQLLVDRNAAAGALIERTRVAGLVVGDPGDGVLGMAYVSEFEDVRVGDVVVTSGIDGIYPKGLPIGDVVRVSSGQGLYRTIEITPRVQFNDLEYVLVIVPEQEVVVPAGGG
ncbi:MAG: rod shape-determining protein MreC [Acidobacteria bacterium]|nr:rod shape-determining protein MreC [Acidobacteriota bacterium]